MYVVVFSEHDILHFRDNGHLLKYHPVKVPLNSFDSFNCSNQAGLQVSKFSFALNKYKKLIESGLRGWNKIVFLWTNFILIW